MTPERRIDANIERILRAAGTSLRHYENHGVVESMRTAMRKIMSDSYIQGSNDCDAAFKRGNNSLLTKKQN